MAMTQGKNDINLYWNDKNNKKKNFYFQLFSLFFPLFGLVLWYTATQCTNKTLLYDNYTTSEQGHSG